MKLYFMRHGMAAHVAGMDAERPLTAEGRRDVATVIDSRASSLTDTEMILVSPYRRTRQTAEIVRERLSFQGQLRICDELTPDSYFEVLAGLLNKLDLAAVLLVTHQPLIGNVVSGLVGDPQLRAIEPAWLVALETEAILPGYADLTWLQMPAS